jgi:hypothetical protein
MADDNVVPIEQQIPGRHRIEGTADLEIAYNRRGDDVVVRVNKRGCRCSACCWSMPPRR